MRRRTIAREYSLKILYQKDITSKTIEHAAEDFWLTISEESLQDPLHPEVRDFTNRLVLGINDQLKLIDDKISEYATNWQLKRMAIIDRNILRLGVYELCFAPDIPPKVTINEAVELAKRFGDVDSSKFVNGILDKIHKTEVLQQENDS